MQPAAYRHCCTVSKEIPYGVIESSSKGTQSGVGVLQIGRVVWLDHKLGKDSGQKSVQAFVGGVGLITVDPVSLSAAR